MNPHAWHLKDLEAVPKNGMRVLSTFSCGGGSTMGYKMAGFDVIAANDIDPVMEEHYKMNLNPKHYFLMPIKELVEQARAKELPEELYGIDILDGSPPCSAFSIAGNRDSDWGKEKVWIEGRASQVLDDLFFDYLNLVDTLRPTISIAENVKGLITGNARGFTKLIFQRYREIGYHVQLFLLNSADCGVPQRRERVFFIAMRQDLYDEQKRSKLVLDPQGKWVTVSEAFKDLPPIDADEMLEVELTPQTEIRDWWFRTAPGETYAYAVKRADHAEQNRAGYKFFGWRKYHPDLPGFTLTATNCSLHWSETRTLTFAERVRIGSFPDDYEVTTKKIGRYMIGMSVPPKMMRTVAEAVRDQWLT